MADDGSGHGSVDGGTADGGSRRTDPDVDPQEDDDPAEVTAGADVGSGPADGTADDPAASGDAEGGRRVSLRVVAAVLLGVLILGLVWPRPDNPIGLGSDDPGADSLGGGTDAGRLRFTSDSGAPAGQTVSTFFGAQREGDCELLLTVVSEASWSDGGRRDRGEFLDQCEEAVDGYDPSVTDVSISFDGRDPDEVERASVSANHWPGGISRPNVTYLDDAGFPDGVLVLEDGMWKVELDGAVFSIGPRPDEVLTDYVSAYNRGDCPRMVGLLSEEARTQGEAGGDTDLLAHCRASVEFRETLAPLSLDVTSIEIELDGTDRAEARVDPTWRHQLEGDAEHVTLARQGLAWRLGPPPDGEPAVLTTMPGGPLPRATADLELQALLPSEIEVDGAPCFNFSDERRQTLHSFRSELGIQRIFGTCDAHLSVLRATDDGAAETAVDEIRTTVLAEDRADHGPNQEIDLPGYPDAFGARTSCASDGCGRAVAVTAQGEVVIFVGTEGDEDDVAAALEAQLERLP